ncbi:helix-turn-helix domain-containing protein [Streptomyces angustmyceticus]|nr:helix-turn-helix domain-containing protein [Streptomyces angustmyceticus]UAL70992.1 helix-turn-helix domain-containing protein [Streptomyces angustmyceticus]
MGTSFGTILRDHRQRAGITQRQLADLAGLSERAVRDLEVKRTHRPRLDTVRMLVQALRLTGRAQHDFESAAGRARPADLASHALSGSIAPPTPTNGLVGREQEVHALIDWLVTRSERLVTLTGVGGVGKTRLAADIARRLHADDWPVLWISRQGAPQFPFEGSIRSYLDGSTANLADVVQGLSDVVGDKPSLLVCDAAESIDPLCAQLLLQRFTTLRIVLTARTPAGGPSERVFPVFPLLLPDRGGHEQWHEPTASILLLRNYVRYYVPEFDVTRENGRSLAAICNLVDGVPGTMKQISSRFAFSSSDCVLDQISRDYVRVVSQGTTHDSAPGVAESVHSAVAELTGRSRSFFGRLVRIPDSWSVDEAAQISGYSDVEAVDFVQDLLAHGLAMPTGKPQYPQFRILNMVRQFHGAPAREHCGLP